MSTPREEGDGGLRELRELRASLMEQADEESGAVAGTLHGIVIRLDGILSRAAQGSEPTATLREKEESAWREGGAVAAEVEHEIELCARVLYRREMKGAWADAEPRERLHFRHLANEERAAVNREAAREAANLAALTEQQNVEPETPAKEPR